MQEKNTRHIFSATKRCGLSFTAATLAGIITLGGVVNAQTATQNVTAPNGNTQSGADASSSLAFAATSIVAEAQPQPELTSSSASFTGMPDLPEVPVPQIHKLDPPPATAQHVAPVYDSIISTGFRSQRQTPRQQFIMGARDLYSFDNLSAIVLSAGYEHIANSEPNYGVRSKAFGQRVGAAAVRETSQGIFSEMLLAPLLHEDARYYVMGPSQNLVKRTFYAVTRPLVTRTNDGGSSINGAILIGYAGAAALTPTFYPQINRNFHDTISTYGASIGGAALGDFVSEFSDDVLEALHLKRRP